MTAKTLLPAVAMLLGAAVMATSALAQTAKDESVLGRPRPDYSPIGIELGGGGFTLYPKLNLGALYDDNVFREESGQEADIAAIIQPEVELRSDWDVHEAVLGASATIARHRDEQRADFEDYLAYLNSRLDVTDDSAISSHSEYARLHENRGDSNGTPRGRDTVQFQRLTQRLGLELALSPAFLRVNGNVIRYAYNDQNGINHDDRDRTDVEGRVRVGVEVSPRMALFVEPGANQRRYDTTDDFGLDRDSQGWDVRGGVTYDLTGVTFLELFGGYYHQDYEDVGLGSAEGFDMGAELIWNPTDVATVTGAVTRAVRETDVRGASGIVDTGVEAKVDYEILENWLGHAHAAVHAEQFVDKHRTDNIEEVGVGTTYLINEYFSAGLDYAYGERNSDTAGEDYRFNRVFLRLMGAL